MLRTGQGCCLTRQLLNSRLGPHQNLNVTPLLVSLFTFKAFMTPCRVTMSLTAVLRHLLHFNSAGYISIPGNSAKATDVQAIIQT